MSDLTGKERGIARRYCMALVAKRAADRGRFYNPVTDQRVGATLEACEKELMLAFLSDQDRQASVETRGWNVLMDFAADESEMPEPGARSPHEATEGSAR